MKKLKFVMPVIVFFISCASAEETQNNISLDFEQMELLNEHGIEKIKAVNKSKEFNNIKFQLTYQPPELRVLREFSDKKLTEKEWNNQVSMASEIECYILNISCGEHCDVMKYKSDLYMTDEERVSYFAYKLQERIKLLSGNDTVNCSLLHFERTFGIRKDININLGFASNTHLLKEDRIIQIRDDYFGIGDINLKITKQEINNSIIKN